MEYKISKDKYVNDLYYFIMELQSNFENEFTIIASGKTYEEAKDKGLELILSKYLKCLNKLEDIVKLISIEKCIYLQESLCLEPLEIPFTAQEIMENGLSKDETYSSIYLDQDGFSERICNTFII